MKQDQDPVHTEYTCPNCDTLMREVVTTSHVGIAITMEQCPECGGVWTDPREAFRAHRDAARDVESLDGDILARPVALRESLLCPKDGTVLVALSDPRLPRHIEVDTCPACDGVWFNHGEFGAFQEHRREHLDAVAERTRNDIEQMLGNESDAATWARVRAVGEALSQPVDRWRGTGSLPVSAAPDLDVVFRGMGEVIAVLIGTIIRVLFGFRL